MWPGLPHNTVAGCQEKESDGSHFGRILFMEAITKAQPRSSAGQTDSFLLQKGAGGKVLEEHEGMAVAILGKYNVLRSLRREKPRSHWFPGEEMKKLGQVQISISSCS